MKRTIAVVTTTIHVPAVISRHVELAAAAPDARVEILVAGDLKTPPEARDLCERLDGVNGVAVRYLGKEEQDHTLAEFPELGRALPWNSVSRRNVAILDAYLGGADIIVTLDDDNYPVDDRFFADHSIVGGLTRLPELTSEAEWVNVCDLLETRNGFRFYPRGYPLDRRWDGARAVLSGERESHVVVNAGLWLDEPDVDALTRLYCPVEATGLRHPIECSVALPRGGWSPFNSQNTAIAREVIPAYFLSPDIGRYDDIWASFLVVAIARHLGHGIAFGLPLVRQERNPHDLWQDFDLERMGYEITPMLVDELARVELRGNDYRSCFLELVGWLDEHAAALAGRDAYVEPMRSFVAGCEAWVATFERIESPSSQEARGARGR